MHHLIIYYNTNKSVKHNILSTYENINIHNLNR